jgi:hypothetical protein
LFADDSRGGHIAHGPQIPLNDIPTILGSSTTVLDHLETVDEKTFKINGLYPQNKFSNGLELVPFYQVRKSDISSIFLRRLRIKSKSFSRKSSGRKAVRKLDNITIDKFS